MILYAEETAGLFNELVLDAGSWKYIAQTAASVNFGAASYTAGTRHHLLLTRSGTEVKLYINGAQFGTTGTLGSNPAFFVSDVFGVGGGFYEGKIAHLRIYNFVLNPTQIARQYNSGAGNDPLANGQVLIYECDDTGGTSTTEDNQETTAARDGTLVNSPTRTTW
jgi:hypothetical protein